MNIPSYIERKSIALHREKKVGVVSHFFFSLPPPNPILYLDFVLFPIFIGLSNYALVFNYLRFNKLKDCVARV